MSLEQRARPLIGRNGSRLKDEHEAEPERRLLVVAPWRRRSQAASAPELADSRRPDAGSVTPRAATIEVAALAVWDLLAALAPLSLTGAYGGGLGGWGARLAFAVAAVVVIGALRVYRRTTWLREHPVEVGGQLLLAATIVAWLGVLLAVAVGRRGDLVPLIVTWLAAPLAWHLGRRVATLVRRRAAPERVLIVGGGVVARRAMELARRPGSASVVVGCLDDDAKTASPEDPPVLGGIDQLPRLLADGGIDRVIIAFSSKRDYETLDILRSCASYRGAVDIVPRFFDFMAPKTTIYRADGLAFVSIPGRHAGYGRAVLKRAIDIVGSLILIVVLSPVLLAIALAILLESGRPIVFRQRRIGINGSTFMILKFRTLRPPSEQHDDLGAVEVAPGSIGLHVARAKQAAAQRATRLGAFLRTTSLDELPQLFNVLLGQMSLVGPRPLSPLEDAVLNGWESLRRDVRPGITGLWQVSGRSEMSWERRINLDYYEVRHWSLGSDLRVLADTLRAVVHRRGAE